MREGFALQPEQRAKDQRFVLCITMDTQSAILMSRLPCDALFHRRWYFAEQQAVAAWKSMRRLTLMLETCAQHRGATPAEKARKDKERSTEAGAGGRSKGHVQTSRCTFFLKESVAHTMWLWSVESVNWMRPWSDQREAKWCWADAHHVRIYLELMCEALIKFQKGF